MSNCPDCHGKREVKHWTGSWMTCRTCAGTGLVETAPKCPHCGAVVYGYSCANGHRVK